MRSAHDVVHLGTGVRQRPAHDRVPVRTECLDRVQVWVRSGRRSGQEAEHHVRVVVGVGLEDRAHDAVLLLVPLGRVAVQDRRLAHQFLVLRVHVRHRPVGLLAAGRGRVARRVDLLPEVGRERCVARCLEATLVRVAEHGPVVGLQIAQEDLALHLGRQRLGVLDLGPRVEDGRARVLLPQVGSHAAPDGSRAALIEGLPRPAHTSLGQRAEDSPEDLQSLLRTLQQGQLDQHVLQVNRHHYLVVKSCGRVLKHSA